MVPEPYPKVKCPLKILSLSFLQLQSPSLIQGLSKASFPIIAIVLLDIFFIGKVSFSFFNNILLWVAASLFNFFVSFVIVFFIKSILGNLISVLNWSNLYIEANILSAASSNLLLVIFSPNKSLKLDQKLLSLPSGESQAYPPGIFISTPLLKLSGSSDFIAHQSLITNPLYPNLSFKISWIILLFFTQKVPLSAL